MNARLFKNVHVNPGESAYCITENTHGTIYLYPSSTFTKPGRADCVTIQYPNGAKRHHYFRNPLHAVIWLNELTKDA